VMVSVITVPIGGSIDHRSVIDRRRWRHIINRRRWWSDIHRLWRESTAENSTNPKSYEARSNCRAIASMRRSSKRKRRNSDCRGRNSNPERFAH